MRTLQHLMVNKALFFVTGILALTASVWGVLSPGMYVPVVAERYLPGAFSQDLFVAIASLVMLFLVLRLKSGSYRSVIVIFGVLGFLFYAYGIYAIEQVYTPLYLLYLAVFAFSFFSTAYGLIRLESEPIETLTLPGAVRYAAAGYSIFIAIVFNIIWTAQLIPLVRASDRIEYTFSVFIIDLVFIMPVFVIGAVQLLRGRALGVVAVPAMFVLGVGILSPLALGEALAPVLFDRPMIVEEFVLYGVLAFVFLLFAGVYLATLKPSGRTEG